MTETADAPRVAVIKDQFHKGIVEVVPKWERSIVYTSSYRIIILREDKTTAKLQIIYDA